MRKNYKGILKCVVVVFVCVALSMIAGCTDHKKTADNESAYQNEIKESHAALKILEEKNAELEKENKELQTKLTQAMSEKSDMTTQGQALADLVNIYEIYKSGKTDNALEKFNKIEPMGFDDATLAYYEILKDVLEK